MDINSTIKEFSEEIKAEKRKNFVDHLVNDLLQNIEEISSIDAFFKLLNILFLKVQISMQNIKIEITLFTLHAKKVIFQLFNI